MYKWENNNIEKHLEIFDYMSQKEYKKWLESLRFGLVVQDIIDLSQIYPISSFDFTNELMRLLFESMGDYDDLLPYSESSISKLSEDKRDFFQKAVDLIKKEIEHVQIRRVSFI